LPLVGGDEVVFLESELVVEIGQRFHDDRVDVGVPTAKLVQQGKPSNKEYY
jgi:hypothetical protein